MDCLRSTALLRTSFSLKHTYFWVSPLDAVCRDICARDLQARSPVAL